MSTKMDEDDWGTRLRCSGPAWRSADGRLRTTGVSSRRFISSPSRMCAGRSAGAFRSLDSIGKRFDRLSTGRRLRGLLRSARVDELHRPSHSDVRFDRCARACVGGRSKRGRTAGRSRGGFTTKIHAKSDASGDIIAFDLTGGEASDARHFETLLDIGPDIRRHRSTKATPTKPITKRQGRGVAPVIPHRANEKDKPAFFARTLYKARARIEQGRGRSKRFKRVALRCEETKRNFRSIVSFSAGLCLIKFVHTA